MWRHLINKKSWLGGLLLLLSLPTEATARDYRDNRTTRRARVVWEYHAWDLSNRHYSGPWHHYAPSGPEGFVMQVPVNEPPPMVPTPTRPLAVQWQLQITNMATGAETLRSIGKQATPVPPPRGQPVCSVTSERVEPSGSYGFQHSRALRCERDGQVETIENICFEPDGVGTSSVDWTEYSSYGRPLMHVQLLCSSP